ncbi:MAG: ABC transporter ATP-binding protein [Candidatus Sericytochromatia bacterium]
MSQPILEATHLTKTYVTPFTRKRITTLTDLNLAVAPGETFGLLGPNGAGKTTSQKLFLGLLKPTSGSVRLFGKPPTDASARARVGFLPENPYFYTYLTGREFLEFCADLFNLPAATKRQRVVELLELVSMTHAANTQLRKYSKGMLQRIGIAQALINDPELVFLDEPTSGLDPLGHKQITDIIRQLKVRGKTIFFNSHIMMDVQELCDRVAILHKGKLIALDTVPELLEPGETLEMAFVRRIQAAEALEVVPGVVTEVKR